LKDRVSIEDRVKTHIRCTYLFYFFKLKIKNKEILWILWIPCLLKQKSYTDQKVIGDRECIELDREDRECIELNVALSLVLYKSSNNLQKKIKNYRENSTSLLLVGASRAQAAGSRKRWCGVKTTPPSHIARKQPDNLTTMVRCNILQRNNLLLGFTPG